MANHDPAAVNVVRQHVAHRRGIGKGEVEVGHNDLIRLELSQGGRARPAVKEVNGADTGLVDQPAQRQLRRGRAMRRQGR